MNLDAPELLRFENYKRHAATRANEVRELPIFSIREEAMEWLVK